jgi:dTDP-4-amino-4,6-dideoxygalactose transaminase
VLSVPPARVVFPPDARRRALAMIEQALETGALTLGPFTAELEEAFAARHGVAHAVAVSSGTAALEIIFRSLGVEGREVLVPANTFFATAAAVVHAGGRPRLADVDRATLALSAATVEAALTQDTVGVVMVHIGGLVSPEVRLIRDLCRARGLFLVEDAAHAHGCALEGRAAGSFGVAGAFSFYPTKVTTAGEGGIILTGDEGLRDEARLYRDQGKANFLGGEHVRLGSAWRMSELHAAVALAHLSHLDDFLACRNQVAARYDEALAAVTDVEPVRLPIGCESNYYKYPALLAPGLDRAQLKARMRARGVGLSGEVYASPLHHQPVFAALGRADLAVAEDVCRRHICLPVYSDMVEKEAARVLSCLLEVLEELERGRAVRR